MTVSRHDASITYKDLARVADESPVRIVRHELAEKAREWGRALRDYDEAVAAGEPAVIELLGAVSVGMHVWVGDHRGDWLKVTRQTNHGSLQLDDPMSPRPAYFGGTGPSTPVVILDVMADRHLVDTPVKEAV